MKRSRIPGNVGPPQKNAGMKLKENINVTPQNGVNLQYDTLFNSSPYSLGRNKSSRYRKHSLPFTMIGIGQLARLSKVDDLAAMFNSFFKIKGRIALMLNE
jgi:hypothetical protein